MDPARSGASPPPKGLGGRAARSGGAAEACGSRPVAGSGDLRVGILESSDKVKACVHPCNKEDTPQITSECATKCEDGVSLFPRVSAFLRPEADCLNLGRASDAASMENLHDSETLACGKENISTDLQPKPDDVRIELNLHIVDSSDAAELNPFFPYKKLEQSKVSDLSECGITTGAIGESESHRKWREMKQNGFLSSPHGNVVVR